MKAVTWFIFWQVQQMLLSPQTKRASYFHRGKIWCATVEKSALPFWLFRSVFAGNGILLKSLLCVWLAGPCTVHTSQDGRWKDFRFTSFQCAAFCCIMRLCVETMLPHYGLTRGGWRNSWLVDSTAGSHCGTADWTHTHTHHLKNPHSRNKL